VDKNPISHNPICAVTKSNTGSTRAQRPAAIFALTRAALLAGIASVALGGAAPLQSGHFSLGYTYTHIRANCPNVQGDGTEPTNDELAGGGRARRKIPSINSVDNVLLHYDQPSILMQVDATLKAMRASADALRLHFWFGGRDLDASSGPETHLGLVSNEANVSQIVLTNVAEIVKKATSLGYSKLYIVFGDQGASSPKCGKRNQSGWNNQTDCFNTGNLAGDWNVRKQIIDAARHASSSGAAIYFDLSGESCPGGSPLPEMRDHLQQYTTYMVDQYAKTYGDDHSFVSCHGNSLNRTTRDLDSIVAIYRSAGIRPHMLDMHMYTPDEQSAEGILEHAEADAQSIGSRFSIMETAYDSVPVFTAVSALRKRGAIPLLETVSIWPKTLNTPCAQSFQWPRDLASVTRTLNQ
jgi:hypothetical protein